MEIPRGDEREIKMKFLPFRRLGELKRREKMNYGREKRNCKVFLKVDSYRK